MAIFTIFAAMHIFSRVISGIFHPILLYFYLVLMAFALHRYGYRMDEERAIGAFLIMTFFILVMFPAISIALFKALGLIPDWKFEDKRDRIGPLIATLVFYIWFYVNIKGNTMMPDSLRFVALGGAIALGVAFFINNFSRISLHAVGAGTFIAGLCLLIFYTESSSFVIVLPLIGSYKVSSIFVLCISMPIVGAIGTARLYLHNYNIDDVLGGYIVGIIAQIGAFNIIT